MTTKVEDFLASGGYPASRYTHELYAEMDSVDATVLDVRVDRLCPQRGDRDPIDSSAYIDRIRVERQIKKDKNQFFLITIDTRTDFEESTNPLDDPAEVEWYSQRYQRTDIKDRNDKAVFNTAGSLMKFTYDDSNWVAAVTKNVSSTPHEIFEFENAINRSAVLVDGRRAEAETLRVAGVRISRWQFARVGARNIHYKILTFLLEHQREGWKIKRDNVGFEELLLLNKLTVDLSNQQVGNPAAAGFPPATGFTPGQLAQARSFLRDADGNLVYEGGYERVPIYFPNGRRPNTEQVLDADGRWVADPRPEDIITIEIDKYRLMDFGRLPGVGDAAVPRGSGSLPGPR